MGRCAGGLQTFMTSSHYINKNGEHPKYLEASIHWDQIVINKEDLTDSNWLYIGDATQEEKESQLWWMREIEGWVWILYE